MSILQGGAPKCGNFWLYQIIQQILARTQRSTTSFIEQHPVYPLAKGWDLNFPGQARIDVLEISDLQLSYRISSVFRMPIEDLGDYIAQAPHVWTHSPICKKSGEVLELFNKKVYIIRDPRDRALSAAKYYCSPYMLKYFPQAERNPELFLQKNFRKLMHEWVWHVFDHLRLSRQYHIHIAFYEGFLCNFQQELSRLLHNFEIDLPQSEREELEQAVSFATLKKRNPKHLTKGKSGYWMNQLTKDQVKEADMIAGPLIRYLNYPSAPGQPMSLPAEPAYHDLERLKYQINESQAALYHS